MATGVDDGPSGNKTRAPFNVKGGTRVTYSKPSRAFTAACTACGFALPPVAFIT